MPDRRPQQVSGGRSGRVPRGTPTRSDGAEILAPARAAPRWLLLAVALGVPFLFPVVATVVAGFRANLGPIPPFAAIQFGMFLLVVVGLVFGLGGFRPRDVGLRATGLRPAALVTAASWLLLQVILATGSLLSQGSVTAADPLLSSTIGLAVVGLAANVLGTALFEETAYRGFLLPQLFGRFRWRAAASPRSATIQAVIASAALFTLAHVPALFFQPRTAGEIAAIVSFTMLGGLYGAFLYLRTTNLLLVMGLHGLNNSPVPLVDAPEWLPSVVVMALGLMVAAAWPRLQPTSRPEVPAVDGDARLDRTVVREGGGE